jgi:hypothetical protein
LACVFVYDQAVVRVATIGLTCSKIPEGIRQIHRGFN